MLCQFQTQCLYCTREAVTPNRYHQDTYHEGDGLKTEKKYDL